MGTIDYHANGLLTSAKMLQHHLYKNCIWWSAMDLLGKYYFDFITEARPYYPDSYSFCCLALILLLYHPADSWKFIATCQVFNCTLYWLHLKINLIKNKLLIWNTTIHPHLASYFEEIIIIIIKLLYKINIFYPLKRYAVANFILDLFEI